MQKQNQVYRRLAYNRATIFSARSKRAHVVQSSGTLAPVVVTKCDCCQRSRVSTNNSIYTGFDRDGSRTGTFVEATANNPQPLEQTRQFGPRLANKVFKLFFLDGL
jgi:hypothetical protein